MNKNLISLGIFNITWYSIFILAGALIASILFIVEAKKYDISKDYCINLIFWSIVLGIIGARIYYVAFNWSYYSKDLLEILRIWHGGLAIHGSVIAAVIFIIIYSKKYEIRTLKITDMACVSLIIAQAIGRWGNFINGEAHGGVTTRIALENMKIIPKFVIDGMNIDGVYYIPTFYYESLWCLLGFILLLVIRKVCKYLKAGQLTGTYLIWYGVGRFFIEALRTDSLMLSNLKMAQIVSIAFVIIGIILIIRGFTKGKLDDLYTDYEATNVTF